MNDIPPADGWSQARRVLCVRLDAAGDVLMTEPALRALATSVPGRRLTLLTSRSGGKADIARRRRRAHEQK